MGSSARDLRSDASGSSAGALPIEVGDRVTNGMIGGVVLALHDGFAWITNSKTEGPLTFPFALLQVTRKAPR